MKGKKKIIMPLLLAGVTATGVVVDVQQSITTLAAEKTKISNVQFSVDGSFTGMKDGEAATGTTFNVGKVYLPVISYNNVKDDDFSDLGTKYDFEIYKGVTKIEYKTEGEDANKKVYFDANYVGYYTIKVIDKLNADTDHNVIHEMKVLIEKGDAVINLPVNSKYVIPARVPAKLNGLGLEESEKMIKVPVPTITIGDDEKETEIDDLKSGSTLTVQLVTPEGTETLDLVTDVPEDEEPYYIIPGGNDGYLSDVGTYQIVYTYKEGESVISRLESNFAVVNENKFDLDDIDLHMTFLKSVPSTGNINSKVEIPSVKVTETVTSLDQVNCYLEMTVKNLKTNKTFLVEYDKENGKYYFIPTEKGYYTISYKASIDLFGKETVTVTPGNPIEVKDTEKPTFRPTYEYETADDGVDEEGRAKKKVTKINNVTVEDIWATEKAKNPDITLDEAIDKNLKDRRVVIPAVAIMNQTETNASGETVSYAEVTLPAIYATDNYDYFNEMTYTRLLRTPGASYKTLYTDEENKVDDYTKKLTVKLYEKDNNEIRYKVTDRAGNTLGEITYNIMVYEDVDATRNELSKGKTSLDLVLNRTSVSDKDKVFTFDKPIVTDTIDEHVEVKTFYKLRKNGIMQSELTELTSENIKSNGKYEIDLTNLGNDVDGIQLVVKAYVDGVLKDTRTAFNGVDLDEEGQIVIEYAEGEIDIIEVLNSNNDTEAPTFEAADWYEDLITENATNLYDYKAAKKDENDNVIEAEKPSKVVSISSEGWALDAGGKFMDENGNTIADADVDTKTKYAPFDQGNSVINIPSVTFTDEYDANLKISLIITDNEGNEVLKDTNETVTRSEGNAPYTYTVSGAKLKLNSYGIYTVTYKAEDVGGHVTVKNFGIRVNDKTAPSIIITEEASFGQEIEVYDFYKFPSAKIVKNGQTDNKGKFNIRVQALGGAKIESQSQSGFTPASEGTFLIIYEATDSSGLTTSIEDASFSVTAKATKKPEITVYEGEKPFPSNIPTFTKDAGKNYMTIEIPNASAIDMQTNDNAELTITVSGPNSTKPTIKDGDTMGTKKFEATAEGEYTITYKAVSEFGIENTVVKTIKLGDCVKPTIDWKNEVTKMNLGEDLTIRIGDHIELDDNKSSEADLADELTVSLKGPSGDVVEMKKQSPGVEYVWNMAETGSYTLTLTVKDGAKNTTTQTYKIEVPEEEVDSEVISPAMGTVLVVLSVVVLAGVVVYFVATSKKKGRSVKTTRKNK